MAGIAIALEARTEAGKGSMRRLRRAGRVPGVVYGKGREAVLVKLEERALRRHLRDAGTFRLVAFETDAGGLNGKHALIREVQCDPVTRAYLHVDFQEVELDQRVYVDVPLAFVGTPAGEKAGGSKNIQCYRLGVYCRAGNIPEQIEVDITALEIGDVLVAGDLKLDEDIELGVSPSVALIDVAVRRKVEVDIVAADTDGEGEEEATEEGEDAAETPAEGDGA